MDTKNPNIPETDPVYNVMPQMGKSSGGLGSSGLPVPTPPGGSRKWIYILIGIIVLAGLGAGAYYLLGSEKTKPPVTNTSRLSKAWLKQYFNVEACADQNTCGETADPDKDGLNNYDEFKEGTNPLNPDDDEDGLADGDEVFIYKTEATLKFTDKRAIVAKNNWTDGYQIKNGFDPLTPGLVFTETRKKQIADATVQFKLHEPTVTTLGLDVPGSSGVRTDDWVAYKNTRYGFEFEYPPSWKNVKELLASPTDYLYGKGDRYFVAIYPTKFPAPDFSARIDVYAVSLSTVKQNHPSLKGKTSTTKQQNGNNWTMIGSNDYLLEKNSLTYHVSADASLADTILSTFKFTK